MSYNTRRSANYGPPITSVGQRRQPVVTHNIIGQMNRQGGGPMNKPQQQQQQNKPFQQQYQQSNQNKPQQQGQKPPQQQQQVKPPVQQASQQQQIKPPAQQPPQVKPPIVPQVKPVAAPPQQQPPKPVQQPQVQQPQVQQQQVQQQQQPQQQQTNMQKTAEQIITQQKQEPMVIGEQPESVEGENENSNANGDSESPATKTKPFWMKRTGRVSKAEKMRKRNLRLRKMLQPKNALMVLNELVGSTAYTVSDVKTPYDDMFQASVNIEGVDHVGTGKNKVSAKTAAAETAIRAIVLKKIKSFSQFPQQTQGSDTSQNESLEIGDADIKMEEGTEEPTDEQVSWSHIASFAIHKLFSSWDEDGNNITDMLTRSASPGNVSFDSTAGKKSPGMQTPEQKPAKKLPNNAEHMNPMMLLNQMHPNAKYEEINKVGKPPHIQFTIQCTVNDQTFHGVGTNKKAARKQAAFAACSQILGIQYPPEVLEPNAPGNQTSMEAVSEQAGKCHPLYTWSNYLKSCL